MPVAVPDLWSAGGMLPLPRGCLTLIAFLTLQDVLEGEVPLQ